MLDWINVIVQGVLVGGLYAVFAAGLSLIFGVMRLVNIAHGDLIVLAAYMALVTAQTLGIGPLPALLIVAPPDGADRLRVAAPGAQPHARRRSVAAAAGHLRPLGDHPERLLEIFSADSRRLQAGAIEIASFPLCRASRSACCRCCSSLAAVAVIAGLQFVSIAPRSGAPSGRPPTIRRWRNSWGSTIATSSPSPWRCRSRWSRSPACCSPCAPISIPHRAGAADLRLRGGHHRRARQPVGNAAGRHPAGRRPGDRRPSRSGLADLAGHLVFLLVLAVRPEGLFPKVRG